MRLGVVVALPRERRALPSGAFTVAQLGIGPARAAVAAADLVAAGVEALVAFGFAGGLAPELRAGDLVVADVVQSGDRLAYATDAALGASLLASLPAALARRTHRGAICTVDAVAGSVAAKRRLAATGAVAVDMESAAVGRIAAERGLPFLAIRAISDPVDAPLPPTAIAAVRPDGGIAWGPLLARLLSRPGDWAGLATLRRSSTHALQSLRTAARALAAVAADRPARGQRGDRGGSVTAQQGPR